MANDTAFARTRSTRPMCFVLAVVVVAAALLASACAREDSNAEQTRADVEPAKQGQEASESEPAPESSVVRVERFDDGFGGTANVVTGLAGLEVNSSATLDVAVRALGEPDRSGPGDKDSTLCHAEWNELGMHAVFYFGHPPSPEASCSRGPIGAALLTDERWQLQPGGLRIGDARERIDELHPEGRTERLVGPFGDVPGKDDAILLAEGSYGGDPYPSLYATVHEGRVAAFVIFSGAD
jgi:hypothetical protein